MKRWMIAAFALLLLSPSAARAATLSQFTLTDKVDEQSRQPSGAKTLYTGVVPAVWACTYVDGAATGDLVGVAWLFRPAGQAAARELTRVSTPVDGSRYAAFKLSPSMGESLPAGRYAVRFQFNNRPAATLYFEITSAATPAAPQAAGASASAVPPPAATIEFSTYTDAQKRFKVDLPGNWFMAQGQDPVAVYLSATPDGNPVGAFAVNVYPARVTGVFNRMDAILGVRDQLAAQAKQMNATVTKDSLLEGGTKEDSAWAFVLQYKDKNGKALEDRKLIFCSAKYVFVLTFVYEPSMKETLSSVSQRIMETFAPGE